MQIVVVVNKEGKLTAMLEVREHTICQAKLFANDEVYKNVSVNKDMYCICSKCGIDMQYVRH